MSGWMVGCWNGWLVPCCSFRTEATGACAEEEQSGTFGEERGKGTRQLAGWLENGIY